jgi:hypothetical protein
VQPAFELGLGAQEVLSVPGTGRVVGVYSKAAYLLLPGDLVALTSFDVPSGPIHARTAAPFDGLRLDDKVVLTGSLLQAGPVLLNLGGAQVWQGLLPDARQLAAGLEVALDLLQGAPESALDSAVSERARALLAKGDLPGAASVLGGLGPGLTPAGDDCLAGILIISNALWGRAATPELVRLVEEIQTNEISRAFLRWAARGQSIEPVHRFLQLAAGGDAGGASIALADLTRFGHSSGADLALGLRLGLEELDGSRRPTLPMPGMSFSGVPRPAR